MFSNLKNSVICNRSPGHYCQLGRHSLIPDGTKGTEQESGMKSGVQNPPTCHFKQKLFFKLKNTARVENITICT